MLTELILFLASLALVSYLWLKSRTFTYWQRKGVRHVKPQFPFGNMQNVLTGKEAFNVQLSNLYNTPGFEKEPMIGFYIAHRKSLLIRDLDMIKTIMIKKFDYFSDRFTQLDKHNDPLGYNNLFFVQNPDWRELRVKMSPVFTSGKIKQMYPLMVQVGKDLELNLKQRRTGSSFNVKELCARFTTDLIATIAFGIKANALSDLDSEFFRHNKNIFHMTLRRSFDFVVMQFLPFLTRLVGAKLFSKETSAFIRGNINYVLDEREKTGAKRNDLIDTLLAMKKEAAAEPDKPHRAHNNDFLVAQAALFQTAGYETSSSTMTFTLYELAKNEEIQERLRAEIEDYFGEEDHVSYEKIHEMPYLTKVVNETLRKYPIGANLERKVTQPAQGERFTLKPYYDMEAPDGLQIFVSVLGIHRDSRYWPEPEKYDPERFDPANRHNLNTDAYMPFGIGPHNCIGMRLGLLQTKLGLVHLLRHHRVEMNDETAKTMTFDPRAPMLASKEEVILQLERV